MRSPRPLVTASIIWLVLAAVGPAGGSVGNTAAPASHGAKVSHVATAPTGP
jgi:hypothetical protein